jgi:hypothetical protein
MINTSEILKDVDIHNDICRRLLEVVQQESRWLSSASKEDPPLPDQRLKESLSQELSQAVSNIQAHRAAMNDVAKLHPGANKDPALQTAIQSATDLIMKIVVLDRENEKLLMKKGLIPPSRIPSSYQYRPSEAIKAYQKNPF